MSTTLDPQRDGPVVAERPAPGAPRAYEFPAVTARRLENGLSILVVDLPGRPLVSASVVVTGGAAEEPSELAGATVLTARALTEGTERYEAIALVEAAERLGASLHAEAGWDAMSVGVDVPAARLEPALELMAEVLLHPAFPESEVERLRDERLNDLLQARADPRRRVDEAFVGTVYAPESPYHRPSGGTRETVARLGSADLRRVYEGTLDPRRTTLVIGGDLGGQDVMATAERLFGGWTAALAMAGAGDQAIADTASPIGRVVHVVDRPGSVQTEIRIGHRGLPRRIADFHAVSVMSAILGGLFNSRLNMKLREEKGY
ncbi:MAG: pitrilysin family protein, partial [Chloroflexota bacterium]